MLRTLFTIHSPGTHILDWLVILKCSEESGSTERMRTRWYEVLIDAKGFNKSFCFSQPCRSCTCSELSNFFQWKWVASLHILLTLTGGRCLRLILKLLSLFLITELMQRCLCVCSCILIAVYLQWRGLCLIDSINAKFSWQSLKKYQFLFFRALSATNYDLRKEYEFLWGWALKVCSSRSQQCL